MKPIELTEDEARNLVVLLDIAVKTGGLQAAQAALPIVAKVQEAMPKQQAPKE